MGAGAVAFFIKKKKKGSEAADGRQCCAAAEWWCTLMRCCSLDKPSRLCFFSIFFNFATENGASSAREAKQSKSRNKEGKREKEWPRKVKVKKSTIAFCCTR